MQLAIIPPLRHAFRPETATDPIRELLAAAVEQTAVEMLDPERILALAEDMRVSQRKRVHHAGLVIDSLILSALQRSTDTEGRWLDAQRTYEMLGGKRSGQTSFRNQVRKLCPVMHRLLRRRLSGLADRTKDDLLRGRLKHFRDVLIADGCAFKIAKALSGAYPGTGTDAELKLHAVYSVGAGGCVAVERSAGSTHDSDGLHPARWEAGALYIWDLGYNSYERIVEAVSAGAYVLQRLKTGANPIALASYGPTGTRRELLDDDARLIRLEQACAVGYVHLQRVLDLDVRIDDDKGRSVVARVVCVPFGGEDRYYLATLPREIFTPHDVAELYRVRWEVERFFRGWRGALRLDEVRRLANSKSLDAAVTASLLAAALAHDLTEIVNDLSERQATAERVALPPCAPA
jgi:putative transposase